MKQKSINDQRLAHVATVCAKYKADEKFRNMKMTGEVIATPDKSFIYCDIPKVGCTHWKQIFRYMTHDYEGNVDSPEEIPRIYAHFGPWNKTSLIKLDNNSTVSELNSRGFKFMMSRDPYERLWSGYLDKLFLPDFWWWLGTKMVSEVRPDSDQLSKKCGHDVTFSEFLEFTAIHLRQGKHVDMHFEPMHRRCNPCQLNFHVIGKLETFSPDSKLILDKVKIRHRSKRSVSTDRSLEEIKMLTRYNFDIQNRLTSLGKKKECYNQVEIAYRLWKTFQFNGYIGDEIEFPEEEIANIQGRDQIKEALLNKFIAIRKEASRDTLKKWKKQRKAYVEKAYENIPRHIVEAIRDEYIKDFELFQYEIEPDYIFRR
ncbi:carbohydrate sulfotransferase 11-like [Ruditapes philippinarum]|uniref:carbohydrate sulfotransferase 11-like n=1 Tax=Ruditapes philippinarum TaxID=129788 RepID=UPI00295BBBC6|nr:carbohydrate sulfotransferase 11-like [Ruditapes philippinarum]